MLSTTFRNSNPLVETVSVRVSSLVGQDTRETGSDDSVLCFLTCLDSVIEVVESPLGSLVVSSFSVSWAGTSLLHRTITILHGTYTQFNLH